MTDTKTYIAFQVDTEGLFGEDTIRLLLRDALGEFQDARSPVAKYLSDRHPELTRGSPPYERKANEVLARIILAGKLAYGLGNADYNALPPTHAAYVPQQIAAECLEALLSAGLGQPGSSNTLWVMVHEACDEIYARREDAKAAAGELLVEVGEPGTDAARLLLANRMLINKVRALETTLARVVAVAQGKEEE